MFGSLSPSSNNTNNEGEDNLNQTQTFLSETLTRTQRERAASVAANGGQPPKVKPFSNLTLKSLLMWEKPKESMIIAGTLVGFIIIFGIMEYTMLTFLCRLLQLVLLCFAGAAYLGKPLATSQEIVEYAKLLHETFIPLAWDTVEFLARIITWENRSTTTEVFIGTVILAALGNFFSDITLVLLVTISFFVVPVLYVKNKAVVDGHLETAKEYFDRLIQQSSDQLKAAAASLSPSSSPNRNPASSTLHAAATSDSHHASPTPRSDQTGGAAAGAPPIYGKEKSN